MASKSSSSSVNDDLSSRIRSLLSTAYSVVERRMFGGTAFMVDGNMFVGTWKGSLIARIGIEEYDSILAAPHTKPADMNGRPMRGWILVEPDGISSDDDLSVWLKRALEFVCTLPAK